MDELLSKLRSQVPPSQKPLEEHSSDDADQMSDSTEIPANNGCLEITTSQSENPCCSRLRLDFDFLRRHRDSNSISVADVKETELLRLDGPLWAVVKSMETFRDARKPVYRWELCDETGIIFGSSIVGDPTVTVGCVVCLVDFSLWKTGGNHLNIVERNIRSVA